MMHPLQMVNVCLVVATLLLCLAIRRTNKKIECDLEALNKLAAEVRFMQARIGAGIKHFREKVRQLKRYGKDIEDRHNEGEWWKEGNQE